jgi:hypothetical protein
MITGDRIEGPGFSAEIVRDRVPVTFVYTEGGRRLEVPRHARALTLEYRTLQDLGLTDRVENIASAFWALRGRGYIDRIEISYRAGDPNEIVTLRP